MTFFYDINKKLQQVLETPKSVHQNLNEGIEDRIGDLDPKNPVNVPAYQRKAKSGDSAAAARGMPKPRTPLAKEAAAPMTPKQKSFAKLAPPADKITFADKIAGAKKEVDEMLGDVAAEAMKSAVGATRKVAGKRYGGAAQKDDEPQIKPAAPRGRGRPKKSTDTEQGAELKPDWSAFGVGKVKLPAHKGAVTKHKLSDKEPSKVKEGTGGDDLVKLAKVIASCKTPEQLEAARKMAKNFLNKHAGTDRGAMMGRDAAVADIDRKKKELGGEEQVAEKAVSKKQQKFMGMVHAAQKGEKPASKEVAKVAKTMKKSDAEDFATTKHKGLPEKKKPEAKKEAPKKKKEKTEEAGGTGTPTASSGFGFGKGIYDSMNRELENMIAESMNVSINMSNDPQGGPSKSVTVTATDDDAETLSALLQNAGLGGEGSMEHGDEACPSCGQAPCGCAEVVDENQPDWPTDEVGAENNFEYSGGLNGPKSTGQTTVPVIASQEERQGTYAEAEEDAIKRMMEMAGIKEAKSKPDYIDLDKDGNKEEPMKKAAKDKEEKKVEESIFSLTNLWKAYKG